MQQRGWRVRTIAACLVAGVIINFVIAMVCALWSPVGSWGEARYFFPYKPANSNQLRTLFYSRKGPALSPNSREFFIVLPGVGAEIVGMGVDSGVHDIGDTQSIAALRSGWPLVVLSAQRRTTFVDYEGSTIWDDWTNAISSPSWLHAVNTCSKRSARDLWKITFTNKPRPIPLGVEWRGAVFGSGFWAGVILLIVTAARILRGYRRVLRARCPTCAYPLGDGGVCPECGTPLRVRAVPPTSSSVTAPPPHEHNPPAAPIGP